MTDDLKKQINEAYQKGNSPMRIALAHNIEVTQVYEALNKPELLTVRFAGDQIDDAGPGATINTGQVYRVPYTKN